MGGQRSPLIFKTALKNISHRLGIQAIWDTNFQNHESKSLHFFYLALGKGSKSEKLKRRKIKKERKEQEGSDSSQSFSAS